MSATCWAELAEIMEQGLSLAMVSYAVDEAVKHNALKWSYVSRVLEKMIVNGFTDVEQAKAAAESHRAATAKPAANPRPYNPLDDVPFTT